ncbi:MAG TPA: COX15/CtaA family protein [Acidimicrobiales bacterium]
MVTRLLALAAAALRRLTPAGYRRITLVTLVSLVVIMVTGAAVRLTDSGLGCPTWPSCEADSFTPHSASDLNGMVEFVNRLITGAVMLLTVAAVLGARARRGQRPDLYRWSLGLPAWVLGNAVVGGLVVLLHLAPVSVIGHFLLSLGAVWNATVLYEKAGEPPVPPTQGRRRRPLAVPAVVTACRLLVVAAGLVVVTGTVVTGSGPHAGDEAADRLDFVVGDVARLHGIAVMLFLALTLAVLWMARRGDAAPGVERRLVHLLVVLVAQAAVGYTQYFTGVPALLVGVHVLGAALVWVAVLRVVLGLSEPGPATLPVPGTAAAVGSVEALGAEPVEPAPVGPANLN